MKGDGFRILVAETEPEIRRLMVGALSGFYKADFVRDEQKAVEGIKSGKYSLIFVGEKFLDPDPTRLLRMAGDNDNPTKVAMVFTRPDPSRHAEVIEAGAETAIMYPFSPRLVRTIVQKARDGLARSVNTGELLSSALKQLKRATGYNDTDMDTVRAWVSSTAENDEPLIIAGEGGLRKPLLGKIIHLMSGRSAKPFTVVSARGAARDEIGKALFGDLSQPGAIERVKGGTILIRAAGELPLAAQENILAMIRKDRGNLKARFMFTTRLDLHGSSLRGEFDSDLHETLEPQSIQVPPLRERPGAAAFMAERLLEQYGPLLESPARNLHRSARELLDAQQWPGNLAQLEKIIVCAATRASGPMLAADDMTELAESARPESIDHLSLEEIIVHKLKPLVDTLDELADAGLHELVISRVERPLIKLVMEKMGHNQIKAAKALGIHRNTLRKKLYELGIKTKG